MAERTMDQIDALEAQHRRLEDLFQQIVTARCIPTRAEMLGELGSELIAHAALEEKLLRSAVASAPREAGLLADWEARLRVERLAVALAAIDPRAATFCARIASLQDLFEDRRQYEETRLFPKLRRFGQTPAAPASAWAGASP